MTTIGPERPCPACGAMLRVDETHWSLFPEPMGGYVCPAMTPAEEADARAWMISRQGKPVSRGFLVALRFATSLDAARASIDRLEATLSWVRKLPVVRDDDGDCYFCMGPSAGEYNDENGHDPDCPYSVAFAALDAVAP